MIIFRIPPEDLSWTACYHLPEIRYHIMHLKSRLLFGYVVLLGLFFQACSNDDPEVPMEPEEPDQFIMVSTLSGSGVFIIDNEGQEVFNWDITGSLGTDVNLLDDGSVIAALFEHSNNILFGGTGGLIKKVLPDKTTEWEIRYSSEDYVAHHDVEYLPNGNILFQVWERVPAAEAQALGFQHNYDIFPEAVIEMNPLTEEIAWEWHAIDHIIQDHDATKSNFGVVANNPERININYIDIANGDIMHANGLTYDADHDIIYMTINHYDEIWVIDHSTTSAQASGSTGGNYNQGGDLIYRFGNPLAYNNTTTPPLFNRVHYPNLLASGNMLVFANQVRQSQSVVFEFALNPDNFSLQSGTNNEPTIVWQFTHPELFSPIVSSAVRMSNGHTLIAEGTDGLIWEVNENGEVITTRNLQGKTIWRAYALDSDHPAITALDLVN